MPQRRLFLVVAMVPLLVAGKRRSPLPDLPPIPSPSTMPHHWRTSLDEAVASPPLEGSASALDLEALMHSTVVFTLTVDTTAFDLVTQERQPLVIRQLAADPRWRVTRLEGALVAVERESDGRVWSVPRTGYHDDRVSTRRTLLRFEPWPDEHVWATSSLASRVAASSDDKVVTAFTMAAGPWEGRVATALCVEGEAMTLEVFEAGNEADRTATIGALSQVPTWARGLSSRLSTVAERGYDGLHLPSGEPTREHPWAELSSAERGTLDLRGRHNPGGDGWMWARILDTDLVPWEEEAVAVGTLERMGGSPEAGESFYFQGSFPMPRGPSFSGTVELWFQPDGGEARRLAAFPAKVPRR